MKKIILGLLMVFTISSFGQVATKQMQTAQNNTLIAIKNLLLSQDSTKSTTFTSTLSLNYTVALGFIQGNATSNSFSIDLGSDRWIIEEIRLFDVGGNYGGGRVLWSFSDTINPTENKPIDLTADRFSKLYDIQQLTAYTISGKGQIYGGGTGTNIEILNYRGNYVIYSNKVYFYLSTSTTSNLNTQIEQMRVRFRKIN